MAKIVLGLGSSHGPQLSIPLEKWSVFLDKDQNDQRYNYKEVLKRANPEIRNELSDSVFKKKSNPCQQALSKLRETLAQASPDCLVIIGDDQHEQFWEENMPMFSISYGDTVIQRASDRSRGSSWLQARAAVGDDVNRTVQCDSELARHLIREAIYQGFDVSTSNKLKPEVGLGHAFTFVTNSLMPTNGIPIVPVMVNAFFPPNQPLPRRCYALGKVIERAIGNWKANKRVAIIASGGLSYFIIDKEIDRMTLDGLIKQNQEKLCSLPVDRLLVLGTGEALNWIMAAGSLEHLHPELLDYVPCYRTPAGTGCAMGFVQWM